MNEKLKILYEIGKSKGYLTYEEINKIIGFTNDISEIEEVFLFLEKMSIAVLDESSEIKQETKSKDEKILQKLDNLIDTPEKFYFYQLKKNKKLEKEKEKFYSIKLSLIKKNLKELIIPTVFFIRKLLFDLYKVKKNHNLYSEIFEGNIISSENLENLIFEVKKILREIIINNNSEAKNKIFELVKNYEIKFSYIKSLYDNLSIFFTEWQNIKNLKENLKLKYKLDDEKYENCAREVKFNIKMNLNLNTLLENEIKQILEKETKILNYFNANKLSPDEVESILVQYNRYIKNYDEIKKILIMGKLPIVIGIVRYYSYKGINFDDLIQEGNLALIEALEKYDYYKYGKIFSEFASAIIRKKISKFVTKSKLPVSSNSSLDKDIKKFVKTIYTLKNKLFRNPTIDEIAVELDWPLEKVKLLIKTLTTPLFLDQKIGEHQSLYEIVDITSEISPTDIAIDNIMREKVKEIVSRLSKIEQIIINLRFGLGLYNSEPICYEEISKILNIPTYKVKIIEKKALEKLKEIGLENHLEDFL